MTKYNPDKIFDFIIKFTKEHRGFPPTLEDIMEEFNIPSKSTASYHLTPLLVQGKIEKFRGRIMVPKSVWIYLGDIKEAERLPDSDHNHEAIRIQHEHLSV